MSATRRLGDTIVRDYPDGPPYVRVRGVGFVVALVLLLAGWLAVGPWILAVLLLALLVPATRQWMRPNRWVLGAVAGLVAIAVAVVVVLPDGRLPIPPGGGLPVSYTHLTLPTNREV